MSQAPIRAKGGRRLSVGDDSGRRASTWSFVDVDHVPFG
jgi:hypothetical protein